jgi:hypothetical protein
MPPLASPASGAVVLSGDEYVVLHPAVMAQTPQTTRKRRTRSY